MKHPKPMNRQLDLALGSEPPAGQIVAELAQHQHEEIENVLADLLLNTAITIRVRRGGDNDK